MKFDHAVLEKILDAIGAPDYDLAINHDDLAGLIQAYLTATNSVIVPRGVSDKMINAYWDAMIDAGVKSATALEAWNAMIKAAQEET